MSWSISVEAGPAASAIERAKAAIGWSRATYVTADDAQQQQDHAVTALEIMLQGMGLGPEAWVSVSMGGHARTADSSPLNSLSIYVSEQAIPAAA